MWKINFAEKAFREYQTFDHHYIPDTNNMKCTNTRDDENTWELRYE